MKVDIDTSDKLYADAWLGFKGTDWKNEINVRDFIQHNYTPYEGDESFLAEATPATTELWEKVMEGIRIENATHAPVDFDTNIATTITAHDAGYINQPLEKIVGLQTDAPLKRALHPFGGINLNICLPICVKPITRAYLMFTHRICCAAVNLAY